jgi:hypothetical protein
MPRKKLAIAGLGLLLLIIVVVVIGARKNAAPQGGKAPSAEVLAVVQKYIQAQEDSVGADQSSPTSWIDGLKSITTTAWFAKLQPVDNPSTGTTPYNFTLAHQNNYTVKANLSGCAWDNITLKPTADKGLVNCSLSDETIQRTTGKSIPAADLPFGWTAVGPQDSPRLVLVKQAGKWLVNGDLSGQAL